jgi:hypothetical protein
MFYSLKEAAEKLHKTEEEVKDIVKQGKLREFRDGPNLLFRIDEVEALKSDVSVVGSGKPPVQPQADADEVVLAPEPAETTPEKASELADADTVFASGGTDVLGETDTISKTTKGAEDTTHMAEATPDETFLVSSDKTSADSSEASLEKIEGDVSLDSFGSGSGLLDLSLQADDTSLGGVLDEIYAPEGEGQAQAVAAAEPASAMDLAAETEQILSEQTLETPQPAVVQTPAAVAYFEAEPDILSNAFGLILFLPLLAVFYTMAIAVSAFSGSMPAILAKIQGVIWYALIGLAVAVGLVIGVAYMFAAGGGKTSAKPKTKERKPKKEKGLETEKEPKA